MICPNLQLKGHILFQNKKNTNKQIGFPKTSKVSFLHDHTTSSVYVHLLNILASHQVFKYFQLNEFAHLNNLFAIRSGGTFLMRWGEKTLYWCKLRDLYENVCHILVRNDGSRISVCLGLFCFFILMVYILCVAEQCVGRNTHILT